MKTRLYGALTALMLGSGWAAAQEGPLGAPAAPTAPPAALPAGPPVTSSTMPSLPPVVAPTPVVPGPIPVPAPVTSTPVTSTPITSGPITSGPVVGAPVLAPQAPAPLASGVGGPTFSAGPQVYGSADFLLWKIRKAAIPSTASVLPVGLLAVDITDQLQTFPGGPITADSFTRTGFAPVNIVSDATFGGGRDLDYGEQMGARFTLGAWLDPEQDLGVEASFFFLDKRGEDFAAVTANNSSSQFVINSGFTQSLFLVQAVTGSTNQITRTLQSADALIFVRETSSTLTGTASSQLWGSELNLRTTTLQFGTLNIGALAGFRYVNFHEDLAINNTVRFVQPAGLPQTFGDLTGALSSDLAYSTTDSIRTYNHFYGAQVGFDSDFTLGRFFLTTRGKVALGAMHQTVNIDSRTQTINNDPTRPIPPSGVALGGLLTGPLDQGRKSRDRISFVPELNMKLGYQVTTRLRAYVGYDVLYLTQVVRPGDQSAITTLNTNITVAGSNQVISASQPTFRWSDSNVWAQGVSFGVELKY